MSDNKNRYYRVTTTRVVRALSKTEALAAAMKARPSANTVLATEATVDRIPATEARSVSV